MPPIKDIESLARLIEQVGWAHRVPQLLSFVKPSIAIETHRVDEKALPIGSSKIGGSPDLPYDIAWPEYRGHALDFVAQINLSDIRKNNLEQLYPPTGMLYFFYDMRSLVEGITYQTGLGVYRTIFCNGNFPFLHRVSAPPTAAEKYSACALTFRHELTFPSFESYEVEKILGLTYENMGEIEFERCWKLFDGIDEQTKGSARSDANHRMGGYPDPQQNDVFREAERQHRIDSGGSRKHVPYGAEIQDWVLLLQIDSDDWPGMMWFDIGTLYYCIKRDALQKCLFDNVTVVMQCA